MTLQTRKAVFTLTILTLCALCSALPWDPLFKFGHKDKSEAFATALERRVATQAATQASIEQLTPLEAPLPAEETVVEARGASFETKRGDKQVVEAAIAAAGYPEQKKHTENIKTTNDNTGTDGSSTDGDDADGSLQTLKKEIEDISKPLGPEQAAEEHPKGHAEEHEERNWHDDGGEHEGEQLSHSALAKGLEQAIAGLTSVYQALHKHSHSDQTEYEESALRVNTDKTTGTAENVTTTETNVTSVEGTVGANVTAADADEKDEGSSAATGKGVWAIASIVGLVGIAGLAFVSSRGERESETPLYPPRGPSFV